MEKRKNAHSFAHSFAHSIAHSFGSRLGRTLPDTLPPMPAAPDARRRFGSGFFHAPDLPFFFRFNGLLALGSTLYHFGGKTAYN